MTIVSEGRPRHSPDLKRRRPKISFSQVLGEILLTVGVVALLFAAYESYWTNIDSARKQDVASQDLDQMWDGERVNPRQHLTPELGEAFARLYIPSFGSDFHFAVMEGTDETNLLAGPGRYVDSQMPGEDGNFAIAGHRVGKGSPFNDLGNLNSCDAIVVETFDTWDVYWVLPLAQDAEGRRAESANCFNESQVERISSGDYAQVNGRFITDPNNIEVTYPMPNGVDMQVSEDLEGLITLTTCHPQFSNAERMIVHGMLVDQLPKLDDSRPDVLEDN